MFPTSLKVAHKPIPTSIQVFPPKAKKVSIQRNGEKVISTAENEYDATFHALEPKQTDEEKPYYYHDKVGGRV